MPRQIAAESFTAARDAPYPMRGGQSPEGKTVLGARFAAAVMVVALAVAGCQRAPPKPAPPTPADARAARIEAALQQLYADTQAVGAVVAVVDGDRTEVRGFGHPGPLDPNPTSGKTLVRLESISKLFAAQLLSDEVAAGRMRLTDPLALYAPKGWSAPRLKGADPIELVNLAAHTSGLPRESGLKPGLAAGAAAQARWAWLARQRRLPPAGKQALYSNVAFDLLGDALTDAGQTPYAEALAARVIRPLGMADTTPTPTAEQCARLMSSDPVRPPHPCVDQSDHTASGGLYSTGDDMALWLKAQLAPGAAADARRISQAIYVQRAALAAAEGLDHAGPASAIGLGWIEQMASATHPRILEKTGGGDGFLTYVVIDPARRVGVFVAFDNVSGRRMQPVTSDANDLVGLLGAP
jgi:D-alanyl-D-alanine-carboxypeptidase/D-alanyl-D-alanine-endopeptidase